jgi:hypothetical protein
MVRGLSLLTHLSLPSFPTLHLSVLQVTEAMNKYCSSVHVQHESRIGRDVFVSWVHIATHGAFYKKSYNFPPFAVNVHRWIGGGGVFDPVIHLVRHPLNAIRSIANCLCGKGNWKDQEGKKSDFRSWLFIVQVIELPVEETGIQPMEWNKRLRLATHYW